MTMGAHRFPLDGDVYEALEDVDMPFVTHWRAPFTGGGSGTLPRGTQVRVSVASFNPTPASVYARPLNATEIELLLVCEAERTSPKYDGFSLVLSVAALNTRFRLIRGALT